MADFNPDFKNDSLDEFTVNALLYAIAEDIVSNPPYSQVSFDLYKDSVKLNGEIPLVSSTSIIPILFMLWETGDGSDPLTDAAEGDWKAYVTGDLGSAWTVEFTFTVDPIAPVITLQPSDQGVEEPTIASMSVEAYGSGTLLYQWQEWNDPAWDDVVGETAATIAWSPSEQADTGTYRCAVTNDEGTTNSDSADLTVTGDPIIEPGVQLGGRQVSFGSLHGRQGMIIRPTAHV